MPTQVNVYYFDASVSGPTDTDGVWNNDANAFDGSISTFADSTAGGFTTQYLLEGTGLTAPANSPLGIIQQVRARMYSKSSGGAQQHADIKYVTEDLVTINKTNGGLAWTVWTPLSVPSGGWTWAKLLGLSCHIYALVSNYEADVYKIEVEVTTGTTINNFWGAETGGMEEATAFSGWSASSSETHSGSYAYSSNTTAATCDLSPFESVADAGDGYIVGFWVKSVHASTGFFEVRLQEGTTEIGIIHASVVSGYTLRDANTTAQIAGEGTFAVNTWAFVELYFVHSATGAYELFVDGVSLGSGTGDFDAGGTFDGIQLYHGNNIPTTYYDDIYFMSGATSSADRLGGAEVFSYGSTNASVIPGFGDDLDEGVWSDAQEVPFSETNYIAYTNTTARAGQILCNDTGGSAGTGGPNTDANIDGTANIIAAKGVWRMKRDGGSATIHRGMLNNTANWPAAANYSQDFDPTTAYANYFYVSEDSAVVPASTNYSAIGITKNPGGQEFNCSDMLAQILHVPDSAAGTGIVYNPRKLFNNFLVR